ncbi:MAG: hypothetical protein ACOYL8_00860 [Patescibacteria group bacterium]
MIKKNLTIIKKIKPILGMGIFFALVFFINISSASAATSTLRGSAWWGDDKGYVYFNCLDDVMGDKLDEIGNLSGSGKYAPPDNKFHFYAPACASSQHVVTLNSDEIFGGQAWNQVKGFISFSGTSTPPDYDYRQNARCGAICSNANNCWSCFNEAEKKVYGWARVDKTGEWIRLDSALAKPVSIQTCAETPAIIPSVDPGYFVGSASSDIGSLSFNCETEQSGLDCIDINRNYNVYIDTLTIGKLTAPSWSYDQACTSNALGATLGWCVKSGEQSAYEIVISENVDFGATPSEENIANAFCKTGRVGSTIGNPGSFHPHVSCATPMEYGTNYYWWIRLYNKYNVPTQWYQYYGNSSLDTDGNIDNNSKTFTTFKHKFPSPFFSWPVQELVGTSTEFTSASSTFYTSAQPELAQSCYAPLCKYKWTSTDKNAVFSAIDQAIASITFMIATDTTVSLEITDPDNYVCSMTSEIIQINYDLPIWREIKAK